MTNCFACGVPADSHRCAHCGVARTAGPFTIQRVIAQSPHGRMYAAVDADGKQVALKELMFTLVPSAEQVDAFEREAKLLAALAHPAIPRFVAGFTDGTGAATRLYLAQELIAGESLQARLGHHTFTEAEAVALATQALELLRFLHARTPALIHRDVKPANLIVRPDGRLALVDFGAARAVHGVTHRSTLVGTFGYMPMEQLGGTVSPRSDLYALGATLAHLLARVPPDQLLGADGAIDPGRVPASPAFRRFLQGLVALRPEARFADADAALAALKNPPPARRPRRTALAAGAAVVLVLVVLAGAGLWLTPSSPHATAPAVQPTEPWADATLPGDEDEKVKFSFQLAEWDLAKVDEVARDTTGHRHHLRPPATGFKRHDMFGRSWNGQQPPVLLRDHPDFVPAGAFHLDATVMFDEGHVAGTAHLFRRVGDGGRVAWALDLLEGDLLRFTIGDAAGKTASVEGRIEGHPTHTISIYANFDPELGELSLFADCRELGRLVTPVRPAAALPGAHLELLTGWRGYLTQLGFQRGLMLPDGPLDGQCAFSGSKYEDPAQVAARPKARPVTAERVAPATGPGILRAKVGDFAVFDLHEWEANDWNNGRLTETRGTLTVRRVEGDAPFVFELDLRIGGEYRERPRNDSYQHVVKLEPFKDTRLYAYGADIDLTQISFDPRVGAGTPVGKKTFAGAAYDAEEFSDSDGLWKRLLAKNAPQLALSGGLLESARGKPKEGRGWLNRLAKVGHGETTSAVTAEWPAPTLTPYLVADEVIHPAKWAAQNEAERLASRAAFKAEEALTACAPVLHEQRRVEHELMVALNDGKVLAVESKGDPPDAKTTACLKEKVGALALSPRLTQLALRWVHEGPKADWELAQENGAKAIAMVNLFTCVNELKLVDGLVKRKASATLVFESGTLVSLTVGGAPGPDALVACVTAKLERLPVNADDRLEVVVPFKK